jgi:hypothetical protein
MLRAGRWVDTPLNSRVAYPWFAIIALHWSVSPPASQAARLELGLL